MKVKHYVVVKITDGSGDANTLFALDEALSTISLTNMQDASGKTVAIAASDDEDISTSDVTDPRGIYIEMNGNFTLTLDGVVLPTFKPEKSTSLAKAFLTCDFSTANIANPSASAELRGKVAIWGNPTA